MDEVQVPHECDNEAVRLVLSCPGDVTQRLGQLDASQLRYVSTAGATLLHVAAQLAVYHDHTDVAACLLSLGADALVCSTEGQAVQAMHLAARGGLTGVCETLLARHGASALATDAEGCTAVHWAAGGGHAATVRLLCSHACSDATASTGVWARDCRGWTAAHAAAHGGHVHVLEWLTARWPEDACVLGFEGLDGHEATFGEPLLVTAARSGCLGCVVCCIRVRGDARASEVVVDEDGANALHHAAYNGHAHVVEWLLEHGWDRDAVDANGEGPAFKAAVRGHFDCFQRLWHVREADPLCSSASSCSILHAVCAGGNVEALQLVLQSCTSVNVDVVDDNGATALHTASLGGHVACVDQLLATGAHVNAMDADAAVPLHHVALMGHVPCAQRLLAAGASVRARDAAGCLPVHNAAVSGHVPMMQCMLRVQPNACELEDGSGFLPLHYACCTGSNDMVKFLLENEAPINVKCSNGQTALDMCVERNHVSLALLLRDAGGVGCAKNMSHLRDVSASMRSPMQSLIPKGFRNGNSGNSSNSGGGKLSGTDVVRVQLYRRGLHMLKESPGKGLQFMVDNGFVASSDPHHVADYLMHCRDNGVSTTAVGEILGKECNGAVLQAYVSRLSYAGVPFLQAARHFLSLFRLPSESGPIGRVLEAFSGRYFDQNPPNDARSAALGGDCVFADADAVYILCYAVVMLNTDLHRKEVKKKMDLPAWRSHISGLNAGADFPSAFVDTLYASLANEEIRMESPTQHDVGSVELSGPLWCRSGRLGGVKERWYVLSQQDHLLYRYKHGAASEPSGWVLLQGLDMAPVLSGRDAGRGFRLQPSPGAAGLKMVKVRRGQPVQHVECAALVLLAASGTDRERWMTALERHGQVTWLRQ